MKNEIVELLVIDRTQDSDGFEIETSTGFQCFADIQSAKRSEFYAASEAGYKVQLVCVVNDDDYSIAKATAGARPTRVTYDGETYKILREYRNKKSHSVELTLIEGDK